jgi:hypothetical protein
LKEVKEKKKEVKERERKRLKRKEKDSTIWLGIWRIQYRRKRWTRLICAVSAPACWP